MCRELKEICEFIQEDDRNSNIMDCYEEYLDQEMDRDTLITICQRVLDDGREDWMTEPEENKQKFLKHAKWLGI